MVIRVSLRAAKNEFAPDVPPRKKPRIRAARKRFDLGYRCAGELFDDDGEFARVVAECYRRQLAVGCELKLHCIYDLRFTIYERAGALSCGGLCPFPLSRFSPSAFADLVFAISLSLFPLFRFFAFRFFTRRLPLPPARRR
jgi:hypothetical protein